MFEILAKLEYCRSLQIVQEIFSILELFLIFMIKFLLHFCTLIEFKIENSKRLAKYITFQQFLTYISHY